MRPIRLFIIVALNVMLMHLGDALASKRVALVIGNSNYVRVSQLPNPEKDADAFAALLRTAGFDTVESRSNLGTSDMRRALRDFADRVRGAEIAVVYYAGHGIEVDGANYLIPVDAVLSRDIDVEDEAVSLDRILKILEPAKKLRLVILDACRDNPFAVIMRRTSTTRTVTRGLARVEPPSSDTLVAFAARAGSTAEDGDSQHSPFTSALLKNIATPGLDLQLAFGLIRDEVLSFTGGRQEPFVYGSLGGGTVSLVPLVPVVTPPVAAGSVPAAVVSPPTDTFEAARRDYEFAAQVGTIETWDAFLAIHVAGFYADSARAQRSRLVAAQQAKTAAEQAKPAAEQAEPATEQTKVAAVQPPSVPSPERFSLSSTGAPDIADAVPPLIGSADISRRVVAELKRLGCYTGESTDVWSPRVRRAMEQFNRHSGLKLNTQIVSVESINVMHAKPTRVCPLQCDRGYRSTGEACVKIACPAGSILVDGERCERRPQSRTAAHPPARTEERATRGTRNARPSARVEEAATRGTRKEQGSAASVVCGQTGCFPVRKGCRGEIRPSGHDVVAVVNC